MTERRSKWRVLNEHPLFNIAIKIVGALVGAAFLLVVWIGGRAVDQIDRTAEAVVQLNQQNAVQTQILSDLARRVERLEDQ